MKNITIIMAALALIATLFLFCCTGAEKCCELSLTHDGTPVHFVCNVDRPCPKWQESLLPPGATFSDFDEYEFDGKGSIHLRKRDTAAIYIDNHYLPLELTVTIAGQNTTHLITGDAIEHEYDEGSNDFSHLAFELDNDGNGIRFLYHRYTTRMSLEVVGKYYKKMHLLEDKTH